MANRRQELAVFLADTIRHLSKQDTLEDAGFFNANDDAGAPPESEQWNNDTVLASMQFMLTEWMREHWNLELDQRDMLRGLTPANPGILRELGFLKE